MSKYRMLAGDYTVEQKALEEQIPEKEARLEKLKALREELDRPVAAMLERKYGRFETEAHDLRVDTDTVSAEEAANEIRLLLNRGERDAQN